MFLYYAFCIVCVSYICLSLWLLLLFQLLQGSVMHFDTVLSLWKLYIIRILLLESSIRFWKK